MKLLHYVYCVTNTINGKKYIGKHSSYNLYDNYMGSGKLIKRALKKYGIKNFNKKIIKVFNTSNEAFMYEKQLVTQLIVNNTEYYNIIPGGQGAPLHNTYTKNKICYTNGINDILINPSIDVIPPGYIKGKSSKPTKDTFWFNNGFNSILLKADDPVPDGYVKGHCHNIKFKDYIWSNNGEISIYCNKDNIPDGYIKGRIVKPTTSGTFWTNNGTINKLIKAGNQIPDGYVKGRLMKRNTNGQFIGNLND